jgi:hypothetical protein
VLCTTSTLAMGVNLPAHLVRGVVLASPLAMCDVLFPCCGLLSLPYPPPP